MTERDLRIGVVGLPQSWSTEILADAFETRTGYRLIVDMGKVALDLARGKADIGGVNLCRLDGLVVKKVTSEYSPDTLDRIELLRFVEGAGVRVFSPAASIGRLIDRLSCTVTLRNAGIPMPPTVITEDIGRATRAVKSFGTAILKPLYSTKARGMEVIDTRTENDIEGRLRRFQESNRVLYVQKKIDVPGQDLGIAFLGGEHVGTYARVIGEGAWNTTIFSGGRYAPHTASASTIEIARSAQAPFGLDFTTVDVVETADGPVVFEVSAFGGFSGLKASAGINAAELYADYVIKTLTS